MIRQEEQSFFCSAADRVPDETNFPNHPTGLPQFCRLQDQILHLATNHGNEAPFVSRSITPQTPIPCCHPKAFLHLWLIAETCLRAQNNLKNVGWTGYLMVSWSWGSPKVTRAIRQSLGHKGWSSDQLGNRVEPNDSGTAIRSWRCSITQKQRCNSLEIRYSPSGGEGSWSPERQNPKAYDTDNREPVKSSTRVYGVTTSLLWLRNKVTKSNSWGIKYALLILLQQSFREI